MKNLISFLKATSIKKMYYNGVREFAVSYGGGWVPGSSKTVFGAYRLAWRAHQGEI